MLTIIAFILMVASGINWLMIGLLQYDYIAGIFGYQGSIFSRIVYIVFGAACVFLVFKMFKGKGSIPVFSKRNKEDVEKNIQKMQRKAEVKANVEAAMEHEKPNFDTHYGRKNYGDQDYRDGQSDIGMFDYQAQREEIEEQRGLFDEHLHGM